MIQYHMLLLFSEYCRENYEPVGSDRDVNDSVLDVIFVFRQGCHGQGKSSGK